MKLANLTDRDLEGYGPSMNPPSRRHATRTIRLIFTAWIKPAHRSEPVEVEVDGTYQLSPYPSGHSFRPDHIYDLDDGMDLLEFWDPDDETREHLDCLACEELDNQ